MQVLIALIIVYLVGVGVVLAPTVEANWRSGTAEQFSASVGHELPHALTWPARVYRATTTRG